MKTLVIDASIAIKWVVEEDGTAEALVIRRKAKLIAPELLIAECANILWKKVQRRELLKAEALLAAGLLERADVEILPIRSLLEIATRMAIELNHPAYDCVYLALAAANSSQLVTADEHLLRKLAAARRPLRDRALSLKDAATSPES